MKAIVALGFGVTLMLASDLALASAASARASDLPRRDGRNHPLDTLLVGVNEKIEENRRQRAQQQELARLAEEEQRLQAEIAAEQARLMAQQQAEAEADAKRRQERQQQLENRRRLIGAGVGAGVGFGAGMDAQGTIEMMQTFSEGVANDDPNQVRRGSQSVANDYIQRRQQELAELRARRAGVTSGAPASSPAPAPAQVASNAATRSTNLESKFFGTYRSDMCPGNCYWQLNADGSGVWSSGLMGGRTVTIPISWWPLRDATGGVQKEVSGGEVSYILGVRYNQSVPEEVKKGMTAAGRASGESTLRVSQSADGSQCCFLNFRGQLNAYYRK